MSLAFNFKLLHQNQSQKEIIVNENFLLLSNVLNKFVKKYSINTPPHEKDNIYIIGKNPTNEWKDYANHITFFDNAWHFIEPREGMLFWVYDEKAFYAYKNLVWSKI